jgi:lipopolysaccharide transport system permease protein
MSSTTDFPTIVIRARTGFGGIRVRELWESRFLLLRLARRDLTLRYRQTALGVTWVILQPLLAAGVLSFVFGRVAKMTVPGVPYFAFTMSGYVGWSCFSTVISKASTSILSNAGMISKVFFPRLLLPMSTVVSTLADVLVGVALLFGTLIMTGVGISFKILFIVPLLLGFATLAFGIGSALSALAVPYRDINYVLPVALQLLLYGSPIAWVLTELSASQRRLMEFNPLVGLLEGMRWATGTQGEGANSFPTSALLHSVVIGAVIVIIGLLIFERVERDFADVI